EAAGFEKILSEVKFGTAPEIELSGTGNINETHPAFKVIGHLAISSFSYNTIPLSDLSAGFSWDGEHALIRDLRVRQQDGELKVDLLNAPDDFRLNIESNVNPGVAKGFLSPEMQQLLGEWQWQHPPAIHLEIR